MKIFAHRGASGDFPENTLLAFEQAIVQQADGIELDVHFHVASQRFIVIHDHRPTKLPQLTRSIHHYSLEELSAVSLAQQQFIPTLEQVLALVKGRCSINIELKDATDDVELQTAIAQQLAELLDHAVATYSFQWSDFILSSFNHLLLNTLYRYLPKAKFAALIASCPVNLAQLMPNIPLFSVNAAIDCLNQSLIQKAHQLGYQLWVYTVDNPEDIQQCLQWRVDGIFTNFPRKSREILMRQQQNTQ